MALKITLFPEATKVKLAEAIAKSAFRINSGTSIIVAEAPSVLAVPTTCPPIPEEVAAFPTIIALNVKAEADPPRSIVTKSAVAVSIVEPVPHSIVGPLKAIVKRLFPTSSVTVIPLPP